MNTVRREQLEMAGYQQGRSARENAPPYRHYTWSEEEEAAFNRGYRDGLEFKQDVQRKVEDDA